MNIERKLIDIFKNDLCKDQREIKVFESKSSSSGKVLRKFNTSIEEYKNEIKVIDYLINEGLTGIPRIIEHNFNDSTPYIDIEYFDGIRVYNLLAYLREFEIAYPSLSEKIVQLRNLLKAKCLERQKKIQAALIKWAHENSKTAIYPQDKLYNIVNILSEVMEMKNINLQKLQIELKQIITDFEKIATVPFRDSTTKNMVIYLPELYLENYMTGKHDALEADEKRKKVVLEKLLSDNYSDIENAQIIDFDFSSCEHLTSVFDDPIGYNCHEILWNGIPNKDKLFWNGYSENLGGKEIAISFIIRYLRFGGRKMCYHIFHPDAYKYRFKYDNENFYFNNLKNILLHFWPTAETNIPEFIKFIEEVVKFDKNKIIDDIDEFEITYPDCNRKFYLDLFPY